MNISANPKVSIVIPVYNGSNYLKEAIDSALAQTYKNIEIIVVNDGSNDDGATEAIAKSYGNKIRYYKKENGGVASALNLGIEKMTGEYFSWLSHDDMYYPEKIEKQVVAARECKKATVIYSNVDYIDGQSNRISTSSYESKYSDLQLGSGLFMVINGLSNGCSLLIPRSLFRVFGVFNECLKTSNDYDMWFRMLRKTPVKFIPDILIKYRLHDGQGTRTESVYEEESDILWSHIITDLKESEVCTIDVSDFSLYFSLAIRMKSAGLRKAHEAAVKLAKKAYQKKRRLVSVIMPCYNSEQFVEEAIKSILDQTLCDFELIVVDDSSTDTTESIVKNLQKNDFRIKLLKNEMDKGISGAMNTGIEASTGIYIARMDSDDISIPERLGKQYRFLESNNQYGLCSTNISLFGDLERDAVFSDRKAPIEWMMLWENPIANAPIMYRSSIIKDNSIRFNKLKTAEDYDFLVSISKFAKIATLNDVLYSYRVRSDSVFHSNFDETISNSMDICQRFAERLVGHTTYSGHKFLTVFGDYEPDGVNLIGLSVWVNELLEKSRKSWGWSEGEYDAALDDANLRILALCRKGISIQDRSEDSGLNNSNSWTSRVVSLSRYPRRIIKKLHRDGLKVTIKAIDKRVRKSK